MSKTLTEIDWDSNGWHYSDNGVYTVQYIFVLDALNFCFWPSQINGKGMEYDTLAMSLKKQMEQDKTQFHADALVHMSAKKLQSWFPSELPQLEERVMRLRELGEALSTNFAGFASNMVAAANSSAAELVTLILRYLPGFRDTVIYRGRLIHFYKRAQILVGDLWAAFGRQKYGNYFFHDIDQLTMFADYRVPQILREMKVLEYSKELSSIVDGLGEIPSGSEYETEIRACTVDAVEKLHKILLLKGHNLMVLELDWLLWQKGEAIKDEIKPHHRTRTIYY